MTEDMVVNDCLTARRKHIRASKSVFGLDFVEIHPPTSSSPTTTAPPANRTVATPSHRSNRGQKAVGTNNPRFSLHFLGRKPAGLEERQIVLTPVGQEQPLSVEIVPKPAHSHPHSIEIEVKEQVCEATEYELTLDLPASFKPILDPLFSALTFRFDTSSPAGGDCAALAPVAPAASPAPEINYLAKDYSTFRQLLLDRLAVIMPDWHDRSPADVGVMLVEILAYAADHLSYYQDAVAAEAYLGTARLRQSLRRHARLVDYRIHEGCNARAWVCVEVDSPVEIDNAQALFFVALPKNYLGPGQSLSRDELERLSTPPRRCEVFEPMTSRAVQLWPGHNKCRIHKWGGARPCLPKGATCADLVNANDSENALHLKQGDLVVFEEVLSPWTGDAADADPLHRHAVRIKRVKELRDELLDISLVHIDWDEADALPFPIWISKPPQAAWKETDDTYVSVVRGNILLVDHGRKVFDDPVNLEKTHEPPDALSAHYPLAEVQAKLSAPNLTFSDNLAASNVPAAKQLLQDKRRAVPQLVLRAKSSMRRLVGDFSILELRDSHRIAESLLSRYVTDDRHPVLDRLPRATRRLRQIVQTCGCKRDHETLTPLADLGSFRAAILDDLRDIWMPRYDLLDSNPSDSHFVVEMADDRGANLRFGQHGFGRTPDLDENPDLSEMHADYRVGNGTAGNIPAEAINAFGFYRGYSAGIVSVRNPLPAVGGVDPETPREIRLFAPQALRTRLERAITAEDYQRITMREFGEFLQAAKATLRFTGHEFEALIAVDPRGRENADKRLLRRIRSTLNRYRRIGHEVKVLGAQRIVPKLKLAICVGAHGIVEQVRGELDRLFSDHVLPDGSLAFFHPDRLTFGEGVFVSQIVSAASQVPGVVHVEVLELYRRGEAPADEIENGVLPLGPLEIVRFENNRQHKEFGVLDLVLKGGR